MPMDASREPLKVLCLDGGGCRCYAQLQMLAKVLQNTQPHLTEQDALALRPCEYFDLIVGTSAGGLLAIMLGRLSMTLGQALEHFNAFKKKVFQNDKGLKQMLLRGERFDLERMRQAVKDILQGEDGLFMKAEDAGCYAFVTVRFSSAHVSGTPVSSVRSYNNPTSDFVPPSGHPWTVMEAACATAAAAMYFKPLTIASNNGDFTFEDAGLYRCNNPIKLVLKELEEHPLFKDRPLGCVLSLGTGKKPQLSQTSDQKASGILGRLGKTKTLARYNKLVTEWIQQCTDTEAVHSEMAKDARWKGIYFRFNPNDMGDMDLAKWNSAAEIEGILQSYLADRDVLDKVEACADKLAPSAGSSPSPTPIVEVLPSPATGEAALPYLSDVFGRDKEIQQIVDAVLARQPVLLSGVGGIGKTTAAVASMKSPALAAIFKKRRHIVYCHELDLSADVGEVLLAAIHKLLDPDSKLDLHGTVSNRCDQLLNALGTKCSSSTLLLLDNLETLSKINYEATVKTIGSLSNVSNLCLIVTSRDKQFPLRGAFRIEIERVTAEASHQIFLYHYEEKATTEEEEADLGRLLRQMDGHTLSIILLARYSSRTSIGTAKAQWEAKAAQLLRSGNSQDRLSSLAVSIEISLDAVRLATPMAVDLLLVLSGLPYGLEVEAIQRITPEAPDAIYSLLGQSLLYKRSEFDDKLRYRVLQPISQYMLQTYASSLPRVVPALVRALIGSLERQPKDLFRLPGSGLWVIDNMLNVADNALKQDLSNSSMRAAAFDFIEVALSTRSEINWYPLQCAYWLCQSLCEPTADLLERAEDSWKAQLLLQRVLYEDLLPVELFQWEHDSGYLSDDQLQEFLELSQKLHKQFPERPPYFLAIALTLEGRRCHSREERMGYLPEAYRLWFIALEQGWDPRFKDANFLFFDTFHLLWQDLVDLERHEDATNALINFLSFASLDQWGTSSLLELGKRVLLSTNRYQDAVETFRAWIAHFMPGSQQLLQNQASGFQSWQPSSSNASSPECADACLYLVASSILASDHQTAQMYFPLLIQCLDSPYDPQDGEHDQAIDMEGKRKRLEAWQCLLPVPATADQITLRNFCETLPEQEQAALQRAGALALLQIVGLASDGEFQQQLAMFLRKGASVFGSVFESCFGMPVEADRCMAKHVVSIATPCTASNCESLALLMATFAPIVGFAACLLTDARLWARFIQLLVEYSDRYAAHQPQSPAVDNNIWIRWLVWGGSLQSDFLAFVRATASGATEGQTEERASSYSLSDDILTTFFFRGKHTEHLRSLLDESSGQEEPHQREERLPMSSC